MHSSDLLLFGAKNAIPDLWPSNWNWVFTRFNIVNWFYVCKFRESSKIEWDGFWNLKRKIFGAVFWLTLNVNVAAFIYIENFVRMK